MNVNTRHARAILEWVSFGMTRFTPNEDNILEQQSLIECSNNNHYKLFAKLFLITGKKVVELIVPYIKRSERILQVH